jgi:predicted ATPase
VGKSALGDMHGFPAALTSFIGRVGVVREVAGLLDQYRLVTVTGPGGAGKTRLAEQVARRVADQFADGAWLVELAQVADPASVPAVVAAALGVREQPGRTLSDTTAQVLARQQLLLVLDNCEHVLDAVAAWCGRLLLACDDVRILATSREPFKLGGEARYRLAALTLPEPDHPGGGEAVTLFVDRARQADAHFTLASEDEPAVARLVTRLDGMPLAIELAAARVEALGVDQLLVRIDDRFTVLTEGNRAGPGRQRSLAATVEWSYQLLDEPERRMFRRISAFPGPFTLEAAEAVAGEGGGSAVLRLVDCSLLAAPRPGPDGRSRYSMLETLRAYGAELLTESGEHDQVAAALAGYTLRVAEEAAVGLRTIDAENAAVRWLDAEDATMCQALAWAMERDAEAAVRLAVAQCFWWSIRGRLIGQYRLLRAVAGRVPVGSDGWCAAQNFLGYAALFSADLAGALGHFTTLRDAVASCGPSPALAESLAGRSLVC